MIYFARIYLGEEVHARALGFTKVIHEFVLAEDESKVPEVVERWCQKKGIKFDRVASISTADLQHPELYVFPEHIVGYDRPPGLEANHRPFPIWRSRLPPEEVAKANARANGGGSA